MRKATLQSLMLPAAIVLGISSYLIYHITPAMHPAGPVLHEIASYGQRIVIAFLLFFQFVKVSPHDIRICRWHIRALVFQVASFLILAAITAFTGEGAARIVLESAILCLICPTASAAGVVTERLGGKISETVSYLVIINLVATFLIPLVIPLVRPSADMSFWAYVGHIALRVFPLLLLPCALAWIIRYTTHRLQRFLMRISSDSFWLWGIGLTLGMSLATRSLVLSGLGFGPIALVVLVSVAACFIQFFLGQRLSPERITPGQALGQKNTGFLIWLGYTYMTPVTSVAGGLYAIWQNLFNSWELWKKGQH